jgi:hypothetical protein
VAISATGNPFFEEFFVRAVPTEAMESSGASSYLKRKRREPKHIARLDGSLDALSNQSGDLTAKVELSQ